MVDRVRARVAAIQPTLPPGVRIVPYYDRTDLIRRTIATVARNLVEGGLLVVVVLFLMLLTMAAGVWSYQRLSRNEDPPFTIKTIGHRLSKLKSDPWKDYAIASRQSLKLAAIKAVTGG